MDPERLRKYSLANVEALREAIRDKIEVLDAELLDWKVALLELEREAGERDVARAGEDADYSSARHSAAAV